jgi:uncharacterized membrane protein YdbT with pleckstrin-like domain
VDLREGEHVLYEGRPSWRALLAFYIYGVVAAIVVAVILWFAADEVVGVVVGLAIVAATLIVGYLRRLFTKYLITNRRLRITRGIVRRKVQETRLARVQNVNYDQSVVDRLLKVGTVDFDTAGTDDSEFRFEWVNGPDQVVRAVDEAISESEQPRSQPGRSEAGL